MTPIVNMTRSPSEHWDAMRVEMDRCRGVMPLPVRGGWGYTQDDACIIVDPEDHLLDGFEGIAVEREFAYRRCLEEMFLTRSRGNQYHQVKCEKIQQSLISTNNRYFDKVIYEASGISDPIWDEIMDEHKASSLTDSQSISREKLSEKIDANRIRIERVFWFDITSFFGR